MEDGQQKVLGQIPVEGIVDQDAPVMHEGAGHLHVVRLHSKAAALHVAEVSAGDLVEHVLFQKLLLPVVFLDRCPGGHVGIHQQPVAEGLAQGFDQAGHGTPALRLLRSLLL